MSVGAAQPDAQPFDLAPAVVEEMQPDLRAIAGEPADDDLAPVDAQRPLLVGELTADLQRERAGIGRLCGGYAALPIAMLIRNRADGAVTT